MRPLRQANPRRDVRVKSKGEAGRSPQAHAVCLAPLTIFVARRSARRIDPRVRFPPPTATSTAAIRNHRLTCAP